MSSPHASGPSKLALAWTNVKGLVHDHTLLAVLELQRAGISLVKMVAAGIIISILVVSAWMALVAAAVVWAVGAGASWGLALVVAAIVNIVVAVAIAFWGSRRCPICCSLRRCASCARTSCIRRRNMRRTDLSVDEEIAEVEGRLSQRRMELRALLDDARNRVNARSTAPIALDRSACRGLRRVEVPAPAAAVAIDGGPTAIDGITRRPGGGSRRIHPAAAADRAVARRRRAVVATADAPTVGLGVHASLFRSLTNAAGTRGA